jgi:hypothetical protein
LHYIFVALHNETFVWKCFFAGEILRAAAPSYCTNEELNIRRPERTTPESSLEQYV